MYGIFTPPVFDDREKTQQAGSLFRLTWVVYCALTLSIVLRVAVQPDALPIAIFTVGTMTVLSLLVLVLSRRGFVTLACWILLIGYLAILTRGAVAGGGIRYPGIAMLYIYAIMGSLLLGFRAGVFTAIICSLIGLALTVAEHFKLISPPAVQYSAAYYWLMYSFYLAFSLLLIRMITTSLKTAFDGMNSELNHRRNAEARLNIALEAGNIGVWQWEPKTGALSWDDRMYAMYGLPPGSKVNYDTWASAVLPEDLAAQEDLLHENVRSSPRGQREFRINTPSGVRHIYAAEQAYPTGEGKPDQFIGINMDITRSKQSEVENRRIRNQLETLLEKARIGILVHQDFRPVKVNAELLAMFGVTEEEALAVSDIREFISEATGLHSASYEERLKDLEAHTVMEARCRRRDGEWFDCEIRAFPIQWEGQASICAMITDVTHKKRMEEKLRQTQRLEAIGRMTGGVAHDFNNLLTVILGNAEVMEKKLKDDAVMAELAGMTRQAAEQGADLTGRLLAFSRQQTLSIKAADIGVLVSGMSGLIRRVLNQDIELKMVVEPDLWKASVDVAQLESALLNLAINARDAMPRGGVLMVEVANAWLGEEDIADQGHVPPAMPVPGAVEYVMVAMSDTGTGMDEDTRARLFEPFFTTKGVGKGSGLGLPIVYGFINQLGGQIRVYSELGHGTTIRLYLPRAQADEAVEVEATYASLVGGSETILLVEDHDLVRKQVEAQLKGLGYRVITASDGVEALEILKTSGDLDLLFTDVVMPRGMTGRDLALEAATIRPGLPVLFTSGYTDNALAYQGRLDPSVNFLSKPYRLEVLAAKLRHALDRSRRKKLN